MTCLLSIWICVCCAYLEARLWSSLICCCSFIGVWPVSFHIFITFLPGAVSISDFSAVDLWAKHFVILTNCFLAPTWFAFAPQGSPSTCSTPFFSCTFTCSWKWLRFTLTLIRSSDCEVLAIFYLFACCANFNLSHKNKVCSSWSNFYDHPKAWPCLWTYVNSSLFERCFELIL